MNNPPDQNLPVEPASEPATRMAAKRRWLPYGCWTWFFAGFVFLVLAGLLFPVFNSSCARGPEVRALAQAKQVGLALKLFAGDHDGIYPGQDFPTEMKEVARDSNQSFACLFPTYTSSETIFGNKLSAYQVGLGPDNVIDNPYTGHPVQTLRPGENVYGYMLGLTDRSDASAPLVMDGSDGSRHYNKVPGLRGGTWKEGRAIVIHLDNSGFFQNLRGPNNTLYIPRADDLSRNALDAEHWGKEVRYLDPAVAGP